MLLFSLLTDPSIEFVGSGIVSVDEDAPSISLTLTSSIPGADGLVEVFTTDGTASGEKHEHYNIVAKDCCFNKLTVLILDYPEKGIIYSVSLKFSL